MGKDDKEDSGFGFKDKAKAEETLKLLEQHDMNYRRLTVRGLLGRAKRVLSLTKAEEKIKNIKEAMAVFETWLEDLNKDKDNKPDNKDKKPDNKDKEDKKSDKKKEDKKDSSESDSDVEMEDKSPEKPKPKELPADTVPGLGFKDKETADGTLQELAGRDPDYQKLAVKGLIGRAKRVLTCTKDETKLSNIKEAISIFEQFLDDFDSQHLSKQNNPYVSLGVVRTCLRLAEERGLSIDHQKAFIEAYSGVNGEYKRLRTVHEKEDGKTWDIVRNAALKELKEKFTDSKLFDDKDAPTDDHLQLLLWAFSPEPAKVKKLISETKEEKKEDSRKRKSSAGEDESPSKKKKD